MKYTKSPISVEEQIEKLERRGLIFSDKNSAGKYLKNIGITKRNMILLKYHRHG